MILGRCPSGRFSLRPLSVRCLTPISRGISLNLTQIFTRELGFVQMFSSIEVKVIATSEKNCV